MNITETIMRELNEGPGMPNEIGACIGIGAQRAANVMWHLWHCGRIIVLGHKREGLRGRKARIYGRHIERLLP